MGIESNKEPDMPGFVDVSNMSDLEIKRLGQMDDDEDPRDSNHSHRNLARRTPYGYGRNRNQQATAEVGHSVTDVWAAACAAQRVNGEYLKADKNAWNPDTGQITCLKRRNREIMTEFLRNPDTITAQDREQGTKVRLFLQNDLTFRALKGRLNDFDQATSKVLAVEDKFDSVLHRYELAIVACLPASAVRSEKRSTADERVKFARGGLIGQPGAKVSANVEVLSAVYSNNYNCWFIKGLTDQDQPVFFSYREGMGAGTHLTVQGTVKAHRDNLTQLNRVKVL
jgi:hypothetical protein